MIIGEYTFRVRYSDTDKMGLMYYSRYLEYCEAARVELLRSTGIIYAEVEKQGIALPVIQAHINYYKPIYYDEVVKIVSRIPHMPSSTLRIEYEFYKDRQICSYAYTILAFVSIATGKAIKPPSWLLHKFHKFFHGS